VAYFFALQGEKVVKNRTKAPFCAVLFAEVADFVGCWRSFREVSFVVAKPRGKLLENKKTATGELVSLLPFCAVLRSCVRGIS
jgi:hypothetical protein